MAAATREECVRHRAPSELWGACRLDNRFGFVPVSVMDLLLL